MFRFKNSLLVIFQHLSICPDVSANPLPKVYKICMESQTPYIANS